MKDVRVLNDCENDVGHDDGHRDDENEGDQNHKDGGVDDDNDDVDEDKNENYNDHCVCASVCACVCVWLCPKPRTIWLRPCTKIPGPTPERSPDDRRIRQIVTPSKTSVPIATTTSTRKDNLLSGCLFFDFPNPSEAAKQGVTVVIPSAETTGMTPWQLFSVRSWHKPSNILV